VLEKVIATDRKRVRAVREFDGELVLSFPSFLLSLDLEPDSSRLLICDLLCARLG